MPGLSQRARVWRGELRKTTGGLTKSDLTKNKSGKIVSKRKSYAAVRSNNLGKWIRTRGDAFTGKPKAFPKKGKKSEAVDLTEEHGFAIPGKKKKKKLDSKKTVNVIKTGSGTSGPSRKRQQVKNKTGAALAKKAKVAARKTSRAAAPKQKGVPQPKKRDVIDLTSLKPEKEMSTEEMMGMMSD